MNGWMKLHEDDVNKQQQQRGEEEEARDVVVVTVMARHSSNDSKQNKGGTKQQVWMARQGEGQVRKQTNKTSHTHTNTYIHTRWKGYETQGGNETCCLAIVLRYINTLTQTKWLHLCVVVPASFWIVRTHVKFSLVNVVWQQQLICLSLYRRPLLLQFKFSSNSQHVCERSYVFNLTLYL